MLGIQSSSEPMSEHCIGRKSGIRNGTRCRGGALVAAAIATLFVAAAPAAARSSDLPSLGEIDADTDITGFLQAGVPPDLRIAALRRAWAVDPDIRDFKNMQENDWDFDDPYGAPGFGALGPEIDIEEMVAQIFGVRDRVAGRPVGRSDTALRLR